MDILVIQDIKTFKEKTLPFLMQNEPQHCLLIGLVAMMEGPHSEMGTPIYRVVEQRGKVMGVAMRTGDGRALTLSDMPKASALELARHFANDRATILTELSGRTDVVDAFLEVWPGRAKLKLEMQLYKLVKVKPPPPASGTLRLAILDDEPLILNWAHQFTMDAGTGDDVARFGQIMKTKLANGLVYLWEDGAPVCQLALTRPTPNGMSIAAVFTERKFRGRGYAANLVARVSQKLLDDGKKFCFLFADLTNSTSNGIYKRVGYKSVCHFRHMTLS